MRKSRKTSTFVSPRRIHPRIEAGDCKYYPAFLTSQRVDGPRIPISGERIVIVLGHDEETGLPLELSVDLARNEDRSISIYAIREPVRLSPEQPPGFPDLIVEEVPAANVRRVSVTFNNNTRS